MEGANQYDSPNTDFRKSTNGTDTKSELESQKVSFKLRGARVMQVTKNIFHCHWSVIIQVVSFLRKTRCVSIEFSGAIQWQVVLRDNHIGARFEVT